LAYGRRLGGDSDGQKLTFVAPFNILVFAAACVFLFCALRRHLSRDLTGRFLVLLLLASAFPHELQNFNNEVFSSLGLGCGIVGLVLLRGARRIAACAAMVFATANMPAIAIGTGLAALLIVANGKQLRWLLIPISCAVLICAEGWIRRGSPFVIRDFPVSVIPFCLESSRSFSPTERGSCSSTRAYFCRYADGSGHRGSFISSI
jgi:hypothetical protein